ncbi:hypothetical protein J6590_029786 [Homalodisca vitripennis]|nr:hypothetical protein J6590_029786 [Homalodisca vitripennis]
MHGTDLQVALVYQDSRRRLKSLYDVLTTGLHVAVPLHSTSRNEPMGDARTLAVMLRAITKHQSEGRLHALLVRFETETCNRCRSSFFQGRNLLVVSVTTSSGVVGRGDQSTPYRGRTCIALGLI